VGAARENPIHSASCRSKMVSTPSEGCPMPVQRFLPVLMAVACVPAHAAQEKAPAASVKVEVPLSAEHAPEAIRANTRADLVYVASTTRFGTGKVLYTTRPIVRDVEVVSVKREKKPADPARAVLVELRVTKEQAAKIEKMKTLLVTVVEREGGKPVTKKRPLTLRLEPAKPAKE
jgi:hypothetical protein